MLEPRQILATLRQCAANERFTETRVGAPGCMARTDARDRREGLDEAIIALERFNDLHDEKDEYRTLLKDILDLEAEYENIGIQNNYRERRQRAIRAAWEKFEP